MSSEQIKLLANKILKYKRAYYLGNPLVSDLEYEKIEDKLKKLDPKNPVLSIVGYQDSKGDVKHIPPMLSIQKLLTVDDIKKWIGNHECVWGYKVDGLSIKLVYFNGELILGATRGDGFVGQNVTHHCVNIVNIPKLIPYKGKFEVRGEVYIPISKFNEIGEFKSPRNLATGTMLSDDPQISKDRCVHFLAWDLVLPDKRISFIKEGEILRSYGFDVADSGIVKKSDIEMIYQKINNERETFDFEMDGLVFKYNSPIDQKEAGESEHHPKWIVALKFPSKSGLTTIKKIAWQVGKSSRITPVAIVNPIDISGATISRITLNNARFVESNDISVGDQIKIVRSGDVIPKVIEVIKSDAHYIFPQFCPICKQPTKYDDVNLFCINDRCPMKIYKRLELFVQVLNIEHLGSKSLLTIFKNKKANFPHQIFLLDKGYLIHEFGVNGKKIYDEIQSKRTITFVTFLTSLGIDGLSKQTASVIEDAGLTVNLEVNELIHQNLRGLERIGEKKAEQIASGILQRMKIIQALLKQIKIKGKEIVKQNILKGKTIYITGSIPGYTKEDLKILVESFGGVWKGLSKSLELLVIGNNPGEVKVTKASEWKINMMSAQKFLEIIEKNR